MNYKYYFIYKTTNIVNGKIYVGQHRTNTIEDGYIGCGIKRMSQSNGKTYFHKAVHKYGYENFKREILEFCDNFEQLCEKEIFWINHLNAVKVGYNVLFEDKFSYKNKGEFNAFYGQKHSDETKQFLSDKAKNRLKGTCPHCNKTMDIVNLKKYHFDKCFILNPKPAKIKLGFTEESRRRISQANKNKIVSQETREKQRIGRLGKRASEESRLKLSKSKKEFYKNNPRERKPLTDTQRQKIENPIKYLHHSEETKFKISQKALGRVSPNKGKHLSDETKQKLRLANLNKKLSNETKLKISNNSQKIKVAQLDMNRNLIGIFDSAKDGSNHSTCFAPAITNCCRGKYAHSHNFIWQYYSDYIIDLEQQSLNKLK
jgi:hypothetical protein